MKMWVDCIKSWGRASKSTQLQSHSSRGHNNIIDMPERIHNIDAEGCSDYTPATVDEPEHLKEGTMFVVVDAPDAQAQANIISQRILQAIDAYGKQNQDLTLEAKPVDVATCAADTPGRFVVEVSAVGDFDLDEMLDLIEDLEDIDRAEVDVRTKVDRATLTSDDS